jgi:hypothetical protein
MAGYRTWGDDDTVTADDLNGYFIGQVVCRFPSTTERDAQLGLPAEGQLCFVTGLGHQRYDGTSWVPVQPVAGLTTLVAGTAVVAATAVTSTSRIRLTAQSLGTVTVPSALAVSARTPGTGFTILASQNTDTSAVAWSIDPA